MFVQWFSLKNWLKTNVISFSCEWGGGVMGARGVGVLPDKSDGGARRALIYGLVPLVGSNLK